MINQAVAGLFVSLAIDSAIEECPGVHFPRIDLASVISVTIGRHISPSRNGKAWIDVAVAVGVVQSADAAVSKRDIDVTAVPGPPVTSILNHQRNAG